MTFKFEIGGNTFLVSMGWESYSKMDAQLTLLEKQKFQDEEKEKFESETKKKLEEILSAEWERRYNAEKLEELRKQYRQGCSHDLCQKYAKEYIRQLVDEAKDL